MPFIVAVIKKLADSTSSLRNGVKFWNSQSAASYPSLQSTWNETRNLPLPCSRLYQSSKRLETCVKLTFRPPIIRSFHACHEFLPKAQSSVRRASLTAR